VIAAMHEFSPMRLVAAQGTPSPAARTHDAEIRCSSCHLKQLCLPDGIDDANLRLLDGLQMARHRLKEGEALYVEGESFRFVYAVRSGTFKSQVRRADGRDQVTGFQMAGEHLGLDGLASGKHVATAVALEDTEVCVIPYARLSALATASPELHVAMTRIMSREIVRGHEPMMLLGSMFAEQRVAAFLLNLSRRMKSRGFSPTEFHLRMRRADIGSYLGMKIETVSRTLSALQHEGLIHVHNRNVNIVDLASLRRVLEGDMA
jgi:CRP/FNR family transcriptional regulator